MTNEQVLQKMQRAGFNVTTCGSCGAIKLHEIGESELTCDECRWRSDICDFPDLYTVKSVGGSMTPTEQDKELQELVDKFINDIAVLRPYTRVTKEAKRRLAQLIIADRKRVALEARIDELKKIEIGGDKIWTVDSGTDTAMLIEERIAGLKAQQE